MNAPNSPVADALLRIAVRLVHSHSWNDDSQLQQANNLLELMAWTADRTDVMSLVIQLVALEHFVQDDEEQADNQHVAIGGRQLRLVRHATMDATPFALPPMTAADWAGVDTMRDEGGVTGDDDDLGRTGGR